MTTPATPSPAMPDAPVTAAPRHTPELEPAIRAALGRSHVIDITTTGRRSGEPRRIEMMFHSLDGRLFISGMPRADRTRAWLQNMRANPDFTFHLKDSVQADLTATAREITAEGERREVLAKVARAWRQDLEAMMAYSPLVEVSIEGYGPVTAA